MKPLASAVTEYRLLGIAQLVAGFLLGVVASIDGHLGSVVGAVLIGGSFFGAFMYVLAYRRYVSQAVREPRTPPVADRELGRDTLRRVGLTALPMVLFLVAFAVLANAIPVICAILAGNGVALMLTSGWLRKWEQKNHAQVLREPRWRFGVSRGRAGRGMMDAQDFYILDAMDRDTPAVKGVAVPGR